MDAVTDGGKWDFVSSDRGVPNKEIVSSAGLDFPSPNVYRVVATDVAEGWSQLRVTNLPIPVVGERRFYRWYFRSTQPDNLEDNGTHPIETGGSDNWAFEVYNTPILGMPAGTFAAWFYTGGESEYNRTRWYLGTERAPIPVPKNVTYRYEVEVHRISSGTMNLHIRIYDSSNRLLYDDDDFSNPVGVSLGSNPELGIGTLSALTTWQIGNNGIGGNAPFPFTYAYEGAFAVCSGDWCGPYQDGI